MKNVAGSGGKWIDVPPERFPRWIASFAERHSGAVAGDADLTVETAVGRVAFTAPDGSVAECHPPFPESMPAIAAALPPAEVAAAVAAHAGQPRAVGVLLVRLGGYAAGVFTGYPPTLADAKAGSRPVHGRSAAGGWSQQRFARRREKQASEALQAASDAAVTVFGRWEGHERRPGAADLDAVVLGGDKRAIAGLRDDPRLTRYFAIATDRFLAVPDPKRAVLETSPRLFLAVRIWLTEPASG